MNRKTCSLLLGLITAVALCGQDTPPDNPQPQQAGGGFGRGGGAAANAEPQPYDKVITKDAKTTKGLFTVHQVKERYYYEIPKRELDKELLWNTQIAKYHPGGRLWRKPTGRTAWSAGGSKATACCCGKSTSASPPIPASPSPRRLRRRITMPSSCP